MNHKIVELNIVSWGLSILGAMVHWMPLVQFLSFTLSVVISIWQLAIMFRKWSNKSKKI